MCNDLELCGSTHVFQHRVFGKYWNHVDFPWWFSIDIYVDFIRQKIPDEVIAHHVILNV